MILDEIRVHGTYREKCLHGRAGVKPDIMTSAKALGCGVPVGAF